MLFAANSSCTAHRGALLKTTQQYHSALTDGCDAMQCIAMQNGIYALYHTRTSVRKNMHTRTSHSVEMSLCEVRKNVKYNRLLSIFIRFYRLNRRYKDHIQFEKRNLRCIIIFHSSKCGFIYLHNSMRDEISIYTT